LSWSKMSENLYEKVGFIMTHISKPSYYYIKDGVRRNRFLYRKDVLVSMGHDKDKTEFEICDSLGYLRIYDTGTIKYTWSI
jgi:hypothetical protein